MTPATVAPSSDWTGPYVGLSVTRGTFFDNASVPEGNTDGLAVQVGYLRDLGRIVIGRELSYSRGDHEVFPDNAWNATRLKLIGGYDAGRLPYGPIGRTRYNLTGISEYSDEVATCGLGAKVAVSQRVVVGLECIVEEKDSFDDNFDLETSEVALRLDYRF